jgi:hypothetical protein
MILAIKVLSSAFLPCERALFFTKNPPSRNKEGANLKNKKKLNKYL